MSSISLYLVRISHSPVPSLALKPVTVKRSVDREPERSGDDAEGARRVSEANQLTTETPLLARCGESAGVIEHGMSKERRKYRSTSTMLSAGLGGPVCSVRCLDGTIYQ